MKRFLQIFARAYTAFSGQFVGVLVFLIIANLLAWLALGARDYLKAYGGDLIPGNPWVVRAEVYPGWMPEDIYALHIESWERKAFEYAPLAQFREAPYSGRFVNVTEDGFRKGKNETPWPPSPDRVNVFLFGGSTTFGYGLPDWETVPSFIEEVLSKKSDKSVSVYNFGTAYFHSTHELLRFQSLLMEGYKPDIAIFIDGVNDFYQHEKDYFLTDTLAAYVERRRRTAFNAIMDMVRMLPIVELYTFAVRYFGGSGNLKQQAEANVRKIIEGGKGLNAKYVIDRYVRNQALVRTLSDLYGVKPVFVWQPAPTYKYDRQFHPFAYRELGPHVASGAGYEAAFKSYQAGAFGDGFIWCADIQQGIDRPLYVDAMHYNAELARMLADCIVERSGLRNWVPSAAGPIR